ncbi:hypothetical protein ACFE04_003875 [Oxalis oulophora]
MPLKPLAFLQFDWDKWRNLSVNTTGQGSRDKCKTAVKASPPSPPACPASAPAAIFQHIMPALPPSVGVDDPSNSPLDGKKAPKYNRMILEALSSLKDANGSDTSTIFGFIAVRAVSHKRLELTPDSRRLLCTRLRRLVSQGKLEKVQNRYKIKKDNNSETKAPSPRSIKRSRPFQNARSISGETMEEVAISAALKVAEAENKAYVAAEAVKEANKVAKMADDSEKMLRLVRDIFEQCLRGEVVVFD